MTAYSQDHSALFSRRAISFGAIIGAHVVFIWAFSSGLANRVIQVVSDPMQTDIIDEVQNRVLPPPALQPKMQERAVEVPTPDVVIDLPVETASTAIVDVTNKPATSAAAPPSAPKAEVVTAPLGRAGYLNNPPPEYPPAASRQGWQGTVLLRVRVLSTGKADIVEVQKSSGHKVLDEEAIATVRAWSFVPAKRGELAIDGWASVPIEFKLDS